MNGRNRVGVVAISAEQINQLVERYKNSGIENQIDYAKLYLYSIVTHSTAIEGSTVTAIENQLLFDQGIVAKGRTLVEQMMNVDLKEAYEWGIIQMRQHPDITVEWLKQLASKVMARTGSEYSTALGNFSSARGDLRLLNVSAGFEGPSYLSYQKVPSRLADFCNELNRRRKSLNKSDAFAVYKLSFWAHYELVTIHPWADGNGRTSRLLMNLLQIERGLPPMRVEKDEKAEYIQSLVNSRTVENSAPFEQVMMQLHFGHLTLELQQLGDQIHKPVTEKHDRKELSKRQNDIIDLISANDRITIAEMTEKTGVSEKTVRRDLSQLQAMGILRRVGGRKNGCWQLER